MLDVRICEKARLARDSRFDGLFFTGVLSTGIFCRPICPAPPPKPSHVVYFPSAAAAIAAGLRPCLRCRPEAAPGTPAWNGTSATVSRAMHLIRQGALNEGNVEALAARLGLGDRQLRRLFKQHIGATPNVMATTQRVLFAKKLLVETDWPVTRIAFASGFGSLRRFNAAFRKIYRQTPSAMRRDPSCKATPTYLQCTLTLPYRPPYDWDRMLSFYRDRAIQGVENIDGSGYRRSIRTATGVGLIYIHPAPGGHALQTEVTLPDSRDLIHVVERVRRMLDLDANMGAVQRALAVDPLLKPLIMSRPGLRLPGGWDPFETAARAVVGQQISIKAARTVMARVVGRCGAALDIDNAFGLTRVFPTADEFARSDLRGLGLNAKRLQTLQGLARAIAGGQMDLEIKSTLADFVRRLTLLPGIGPWTAQYIALRGLSEPDAFPAGDLGLLQALNETIGRVTPRQLRARAEAWRPWRAYAATYLWNR
jgi:AraC family transcriptional regulator of adaptative response / DNA-3-methyladenine glycosylase II